MTEESSYQDSQALADNRHAGDIRERHKSLHTRIPKLFLPLTPNKKQNDKRKQKKNSQHKPFDVERKEGRKEGTMAGWQIYLIEKEAMTANDSSEAMGAWSFQTACCPVVAWD
jgi:hypothetical protein